MAAWTLLAAACQPAAEANAEAAKQAAAAVPPPQVASGSANQVGQRPPSIDIRTIGYDRGSPDAPLEVIEFSDYGCGFCKKFHEESFPSLVEEYVNTGKIYWRQVQFDVGMFPHARAAALAGECAGAQDKFDPMTDALFAAQREWKTSGDAEPIFERIAREVGVDLAEWRECRESGPGVDRVDQASELAFAIGIRGTPTFFVDRFPVQGAVPLDIFREFFDQVLAEKAKPAGE